MPIISFTPHDSCELSILIPISQVRGTGTEKLRNLQGFTQPGRCRAGILMP